MSVVILKQNSSIVKSEDLKKKVDAYVNQNLEKLDKEHEKYVNEGGYYLRKEFTPAEYEGCINKLEEAMFHPPEGCDKDVWANQCNREIELIKSDMKKSQAYKDLRHTKELEFRRYPMDNDSVIHNLKDFIEKKISYYHKDLMDGYFKMFVDKIQKICPEDKDYSKTIKSVYDNKNSKKTIEILMNFFNTLKNELMTLVMNVKRVQTDKYFEMQQLIENRFLRLIETIYAVIWDFISKKIDYIDDGEMMNDSKAVKVYAESVIGELNKTLMNELPELLDNEFKIRMEDMTENLEYEWKEQIGITWGRENEPERYLANEEKPNQVISHEEKPKIKIEVVHDLNSFIDALPNEEMEVNDLTQKYNSYFGKSISSRGFGMLKEIKDNFTKNAVIREGKKITLYKKK